MKEDRYRSTCSYLLANHRKSSSIYANPSHFIYMSVKSQSSHEQISLLHHLANIISSLPEPLSASSHRLVNILVNV